ncbi:MAG: DUF4178 domain-containing protein [bacterium]
MKVLACVQCNAPMNLRAIGQTQVIACPSCGTIQDVSNPEAQFIIQAQSKMKVLPVIPLGQRGKLKGDPYEVIGFMQRCDKTGMYTWCEYLLFNPYKGFRWLTEFNGHWNYVVMTKEKPKRNRQAQSALYLGQFYKLFLVGTARVTYVLGEFYWQVRVNDTVRVEDYIRPPEILSFEGDAQEEIWSIGEYVEPEVIQKAFDVKKPMPVRTGVAANQPLDEEGSSGLKWATLLLFLLLTCTQITTCIRARNDKIFEETYLYPPPPPPVTETLPPAPPPLDLTKPILPVSKTIVTPSFELAGGLSNAEIKSYSYLKDTWLDLHMKLVNETNGKTYPLDETISFYSGYDSDGYWTEGSSKAEEVLSSIPDGTYHLTVEVESPEPQKSKSITLTVLRDVSNVSNYFFFMIFLLFYPAWFFFKRRYFEYQRWQDSDLPE